MKVICIDNSTHVNPHMKKIPVGEIVIVIDRAIKQSTSKGRILCYRIEGYENANDGNRAWYWSGEFAPLSDIDETDRLKAWQEERLTQEDNMLQTLAECMPEVEMPQDSFDRIWENISAAL